MPIYKPSELNAFLNELGIFPKKGLSQNFLIDGNIIRKIVQAAGTEKDDLVLEIGPGPGSLTQALLEAGAKVVAVEKDEVLGKALARLQTEDERLEIHIQDIMTFPVDEVLARHLKPGKKAKVIANLPYHLTTPIIAMLVTQRDLISSLTVMVQDEVAIRMTAEPGGKEYGSFTVFLNFYSKPSYAFKVSRNCFYPSPKVDSAIVHMELIAPPLDKDVEAFFTLTRTAFGHRRKMLRGSLKELYPSEKVTEGLVAIGKDPLSRPEALGLQDFLKLFHFLQNVIFQPGDAG